MLVNKVKKYNINIVTEKTIIILYKTDISLSENTYTPYITGIAINRILFLIKNKGKFEVPFR